MLSPALSCTSLGMTWDKTTSNQQHVNGTQSSAENQLFMFNVFSVPKRHIVMFWLGQEDNNIMEKEGKGLLTAVPPSVKHREGSEERREPAAPLMTAKHSKDFHTWHKNPKETSIHTTLIP